MPTGERIPRTEAARRLGVSLVTLDRWAASGALTTRQKARLSGRVTFDAAEVEQLRRDREAGRA